MLGAVGRPGRDGLGHRAGHAAPGTSAFVATVPPGVAVRPFTLFVNKAIIERAARPPHLGCRRRPGWPPASWTPWPRAPSSKRRRQSLLLVAAVWVDPAADDERPCSPTTSAAVARRACAPGRLGRPSVADALAGPPRAAQRVLVA